VHLSGTIVWPDSATQCPAVVLVGGSGPSDRHNEGFFDLLAESLVEAGVAVLRYDKRGVGGSSGTWPNATVDDLASDAAAALATLRSTPVVRATRVGVFGHSEGGWVALRLAAQAPELDYVILNSCPAVSFFESEVFALTQAGVEEAAASALLEGVIGAVRSGGVPADARRIVTAWEDEPWYDAVGDFVVDDAAWALLGAWHDYDPGADLERLHAPTLIVLGGRDDIVPVQASVRRFEATAAHVGRSQHVRVFADGGHRLQTDTGFADGYLAAISRWCRGDPLVA